jgi:hypothetical protein
MIKKFFIAILLMIISTILIGISFAEDSYQGGIDKVMML